MVHAGQKILRPDFFAEVLWCIYNFSRVSQIKVLRVVCCGLNESLLSVVKSLISVYFGIDLRNLKLSKNCFMTWTQTKVNSAFNSNTRWCTVLERKRSLKVYCPSKYKVIESIRSHNHPFSRENYLVLTGSEIAENFQREMLPNILRYFSRVSIYLQNIHGLMGLSDLDGLYIILTKNRWP